MAQNEFSKKELGAWKQHPEAFFGQLEDKHEERHCQIKLT